MNVSKFGNTTAVSGHSWNAYSAINVSESGKVTAPRFVHPMKARDSIAVTLSGMSSEVRLDSLNARPPIIARLWPMLTEERRRHKSKAAKPKAVTESGMVTEIRFEQLANASALMNVTVSGMYTEVMVEHDWKALLWTVVQVAGMET